MGSPHQWLALKPVALDFWGQIRHTQKEIPRPLGYAWVKIGNPSAKFVATPAKIRLVSPQMFVVNFSAMSVNQTV
jgi:hypothetical protein